MTDIKEHPVLTKSKIIEIIKSIEKEKDVELIEENVNAGTEPGVNYASDIVKADVTAKVLNTVNFCEFHFKHKCLRSRGRPRIIIG